MPTYRPEHANRPGRITTLRGIVFQNDGASTVGRLAIRPLEAMDRWLAGVRPSLERPPLAMHAGLHVVLDDGREFVAEQLVGTMYMDFENGLNWTPLAEFRARDRGGWDLTLPATCFRGVDDGLVQDVVARLNTIRGRAFMGEDCTAFIERTFGRRLFADSPLLHAVGVSARIGDPALPLLRSDVELEDRARTLLHGDALVRLPDASAGADSPNVRIWFVRLTVAAAVGAAGGLAVSVWFRPRASGRSVK